MLPNSPKVILQERRILEQALKALWDDSGVNYWQYPVFSPDGKIIAYRLKRYPHSNAVAKYLWLDGKPANPDAQWYILPDTVAQIKAAGGVVYLANGEPALLAYHAAGIHNVIATTLSEIAVPSGIVQYLRSIGVSRLLYPVDKDEAGLKSAVNWRDALSGSGIDFEAYKWPENMPQKADANDVLISVDGNTESFRLVISSCQALELPLPETKPASSHTELSGETPKSLIEALISRLNAQGFASDGWSKNFSCPMGTHEDKQASAGINRDSGWVKCFACGKHSPQDVAKALGINVELFRSEKPAKKGKKKPDSNSSLHETPKREKDAWALEVEQELEKQQSEAKTEKLITYNPAPKIGWINQDELPIAWITTLLHLCHSKSATPVYAVRFHRAVRKGLINPKAFTISEAMQVMGTPRLSTTDFIDYGRKIHLFMDSDTQVVNEELSIPAKSIQKSKGRPANYYAVNEDTGGLISHLIELLRPELLERLADKELAPINESMRDSMEWNYREWSDWMKNHENPKQRHIAQLIEEKLVDLLENRSSYEFSEADLETTAALRGKIAKITLAPYSQRIIQNEDGTETVIPATGIQLSRAKLALELGNSEGSLAKLFADNGIGTKRVKGWIEVPNANGADIESELREAPHKLNSSLGGVAIGLSMKVWDAGKERRIKLSYGALARANFRKWNGRIIKMDILVEQPSLLWNMTSEEIKEKQAKEAEKEAQAMENGEVVENAQITPKEAKEAKPKVVRKPVFVRGKDRTKTVHSPEWMQEQLAMRVHVHTESYRLENLTLLSAKNEVIVRLENQAAVMSWVKANGAKEYVRTVESFFNPAPAVPVPAPSQIDTSRQFTLKTEASKAMPSEKPRVTPVTPDEGWSWANDPEGFDARMAALGGGK